MRVGFVGLGAMGRPMASNVLSGGHQVTVFDREPAATDGFAASGGTVAEGGWRAAESCEVLITMLPNPGDAQRLMLGPDADGSGGLAEVMPRGSTYVDMGTSDPQLAQRMAERLAGFGVDALDCPVVRTSQHAADGTLLVLAGGSERATRRVRPVLDCVASEVLHLGGPGAGQAMKLVTTMLSLAVAEAVGEALAVGTRAGLDVEQVRRVTERTTAQTAQLDVALWNKGLAGDLAPGLALWLAEKDAGLAAGLAERFDAPVPLLEATLRRCAELRELGYADADVGVLATAQLEPPILPPMARPATAPQRRGGDARPGDDGSGDARPGDARPGDVGYGDGSGWTGYGDGETTDTDGDSGV